MSNSNSFFSNEQKVRNVIILITAAVLGLVALMYSGALLSIMPAMNQLDFIPLANALLNGTTFCLLIAAVMAIKKGNRTLHQNLMTLAVALSALFLVFYVLYHSSHESTKFGGEGMVKAIYFFMLITHIVTAAIILPMVLVTYSRALAEKFDQHKKIAKITYPIWLYVTFTGVIVYCMIAPYYK